MAGVVEDQEVMRSIVFADEVHHAAIELDLGFGAIVKANNIGVVVKALLEQALELFDLFPS